MLNSSSKTSMFIFLAYLSFYIHFLYSKGLCQVMSNIYVPRFEVNIW